MDVSWKFEINPVILYVQNSKIPKGECYTDKDTVSWECAPTMATIIFNLFMWFLFLLLSRELYLDCRISEQQKNQHGWSCLSSGGADEQTVKGLFGSPRGMLDNGRLSCGREYFCVRGLVKVASSPLLALLGFEGLVFSFRALPSYGWFQHVQPAVKIQAPPMLSRESWFFHYWHPPMWLKCFRSHLWELWTYNRRLWLMQSLWSWPNTTRFLVMPRVLWAKHLWGASNALQYGVLATHLKVNMNGSSQMILLS